jgi:acyl carrier protein
MNLFEQAVCEVLEVAEIGLDDEFRAFPLWCSLQGFGILVMMENDWHAPLGVERFLRLRTVRDLYREAFIALAAEVFGVERSALSGDTPRGGIPQWDSVNHLRLVMEAEKRFGVAYPLEAIPALERLDDFLVR